MKKKITLLILLVAMIFPVFAQKGGTDISTAINDAASEIARKVSGGKVVAVTNFTADTKELSEWLENEMFKALSKKAIKLVERNAKNMNILNREIDFQYSGAVSDETIAEYGKQLGAQYIVYGSFEQFGGSRSFDFRLTDIETFEVVTAKSYEIAKSQALTELLGTEMQLVSISDYIAVINSLDTKLNAVQKEMSADRDRAENAIRMEYQKKINAKTEEITALYDGMYSGARLRAEIENAVQPIESERDVLLKPVAENSRAKFADQISTIENNKSSILRELEKTNFTVGANSISVELLRKMDNATETAYFSLSLRSTDKYVNYSLTDRIDPATPADFKKIRDAAETAKSACGAIEYSLKPKASNTTTFDIIVSSVRVYDSKTGDTLYNCAGRNLTHTNGGTVNMAAQKGGAADRNVSTGSSPTSNANTSAASSSSSGSTTKTDISSTQNKVIASSTGTTENPFVQDTWYVSTSDAKGVSVNAQINYKGQLVFSGNTGKQTSESRWINIGNWNREEMQKFIRKGSCINFKVKGDGHTYVFSFSYKDNENHNPTTYDYKFKTKNDEITFVSIPYNKMKQESWTEYQKFDINKVNTVSFCYDFDSNKKNNESFGIAMYDFEVTN